MDGCDVCRLSSAAKGTEKMTVRWLARAKIAAR